MRPLLDVSVGKNVGGRATYAIDRIPIVKPITIPY